jgi:hypothetical protein
MPNDRLSDIEKRIKQSILKKASNNNNNNDV